MSDWLQQLRNLGPPQRRRHIQMGDGYWGITSQGDDPLWKLMVAVIEAAEDLEAIDHGVAWPDIAHALAALEQAVTEANT